jgi:hypothetical protein
VINVNIRRLHLFDDNVIVSPSGLSLQFELVDPLVSPQLLGTFLHFELLETRGKWEVQS